MGGLFWGLVSICRVWLGPFPLWLALFIAQLTVATIINNILLIQVRRELSKGIDLVTKKPLLYSMYIKKKLATTF